MPTTFEALPKPASGTRLRYVRVKRDWLRVRDAPTLEGRILLRIARPTGWVNEDYVRDVGQG
jgi:hypothetical protein